MVLLQTMICIMVTTLSSVMQKLHQRESNTSHTSKAIKFYDGVEDVQYKEKDEVENDKKEVERAVEAQAFWRL